MYDPTCDMQGSGSPGTPGNPGLNGTGTTGDRGATGAQQHCISVGANLNVLRTEEDLH